MFDLKIGGGAQPEERMLHVSHSSEPLGPPVFVGEVEALGPPQGLPSAWIVPG